VQLLARERRLCKAQQTERRPKTLKPVAGIGSVRLITSTAHELSEIFTVQDGQIVERRNGNVNAHLHLHVQQLPLSYIRDRSIL